jgi:hypothetical protein
MDGPQGGAGMSAMPPIATELIRLGELTQCATFGFMQRSKPRARLQQLFDHLVGTGDERRRHVQTDRLGCLQVDDELELHRPQDG